MRNIGILCALLAAIIWGLIYNIDEKLVIKSSPMTIFLLGNVLQIILLIPYLFTSSWKSDISTMGWTQFRLLFLNEILYLISGLAILYAIKYLNASTAASIELSYPLFVILFAYILFHGEININVLIGAILIFIGGLIIIK